MLSLVGVGVQSEAHLPFAGLHQLLWPILQGVEALPVRHRAALQTAFGMTDATAPDQFLIALATLELLAETAVRSPLLVVVDDAHWLDPPTAEVLAFVARRLESEPIVLLVAVREGHATPLQEAGLPELPLTGLAERPAGALLDAHAPGLPAQLRSRLLAQAEGNPLALVELPAALRAEPLPTEPVLPALPPLTQRLEQAFAARMSELPAATHALLEVAAADDGEDLSEMLAALALLHPRYPPEKALQPAVEVRLVEVDEKTLRFRHPLVRSAIHQATDVTAWRAAHGALAQVLTGQPDRRAWHRAAASVGVDDAVASELEAAADRAQRRGAITVAVAALERAASLSGDPRRRSRRLLRAAELAVDLGRRDLVRRLLQEDAYLELGLAEQARLLWVQEMTDPQRPPATGWAALIDGADRALGEADVQLALDLLWIAAQRCWWTEPGERARTAIVAAAGRVPVDDDDPRLLAILAYASPIEQASTVISQLTHWASRAGGDATTNRLLGNAAIVVGHLELATGFMAAAITDLRAQGRLGHLARVLVLYAWVSVHLGDWKVAMSAAEEGGRLAVETREPVWVAGTQVVKALLAGLRGEQEVADALAKEAEQIALPTGIRFILASVQGARGLAALSGGRHAEAHHQLRRLFDPADPAHHQISSLTAIGDLAEAAVHSGHRQEAAALLKELTPLAGRTPAPGVQLAMRHAAALLAEDQDAEQRFQAALDDDLTHRPLARGRLLLAYGAWLRRQRRVAESRAPLRAARDIFDALGAVSWGERARQELRAAGETSRRPAREAWDQLTPQELQVAQLAADGLSNREIGQQLFLSHRTVGSHLYRIFPKLGISSRAQLRGVLDPGAAVPS
jgi:DNA-binding CsgD family transcriptional regulator/Tfp pilus assembly protein PilF